jgi:hypothetical protein
MAKEHLVHARELIANGWIKRKLEDVVDGKTCYCLDGALIAAHGEPDANSASYGFLMENEEAAKDVSVLAKNLPEDYRAEFIVELKRVYAEAVEDLSVQIDMLWEYNDELTTTQAEVLAVLDKAIANYPEV